MPLARIRSVPRPAPWVRRVIFTTAGAALLVTGVAMIVLPGPAIVFIPAGLALLAADYPLAHRLLARFRQWLSGRARSGRIRARESSGATMRDRDAV